MRWVVLASAYAILWFLALQILLPIGITSSNEAAPSVLGGADPGALHSPRLGRTVITATVVAAVLWAGFYARVRMKVVNVEAKVCLPRERTAKRGRQCETP